MRAHPWGPCEASQPRRAGERALESARRYFLAAATALTLALVLGGTGACNRTSPTEREAFQLRVPVSSSSAPFASALYQSLGVEMKPGHRLTLLDNGAVFDGIEAEIREAKRSVNVVMYIWAKGAASDRVVAALVERAKAGVACRVVIDDFGSPDFGDDVKPALAAAGCQVRVFRPVLSKGDELARNHRKLVVVDGRVAFTGGFGVRDDWLGDGVANERWRDTNVRFTGPAVLAAQQAFAENWQETGGELLPPEDFPAPDASGPTSAALVASTASPVLTRAERLTQLMIQAATKRLWIANAYFVPSKAILEMLERKATEGVDVRVLTAGKKSDSKPSFGIQNIEYGALLAKGVRVFEYQPSMMHSKTMVVDDELAVVSTLNLDPLSLGKLEEVALVARDAAFAAALAKSFEADCGHAKEQKR